MIHEGKLVGTPDNYRSGRSSTCAKQPQAPKSQMGCGSSRSPARVGVLIEDDDDDALYPGEMPIPRTTAKIPYWVDPKFFCRILPGSGEQLA